MPGGVADRDPAGGDRADAAPSANGVSIEEIANTVSIRRASPAVRGAGAQRVGGAAEDDPDRRR